MAIRDSTVYLGVHITDRLKSLLGSILIANGSRTDIGENIYVDQPISNRHELPCLVLLETEQTGQEDQAGLLVTEIGYTIGAFVNSQDEDYEAVNYTPEPGAEWAIRGNLIADIREKLETSICPLSDLGAMIEFESSSPIRSESGGEYMGVELRYSVRFGAVHGDFSNTP